MAAPVFVSDTDETGSVANLWGVTMPASRPDDEFFLAIGATDGTDSATTVIPGTPAWTEHFTAAHTGAGSFSIHLYSRKGSSEPADYNFTHAGGSEGYASSVLHYSGIDLTDWIGAISAINEGDTGTTPTAPSITAESSDSVILRCYFCDTQVFTATSSTDRAFSGGGGGGTAAVAVGEDASPGASNSTGTATATLDSDDDWAAITIEILGPSAAGSNLTFQPNSMSGGMAGMTGGLNG